MNLSEELSERFFQFEQRHDLLNQRIWKVRYWEIFRFSLHRQLLQKFDIYEQKGAPHPSSVKSAYRKIKAIAVSLFRYNPFFARPADILFFYLSRKVKREDGSFEEIYSEIFRRNCPKTTAALDLYISSSESKPIRTDNLLMVDGIVLVANIAANLIRPLFFSIRRKIKEILKLATTEFNVSFEDQATILTKRLIAHRFSEALFKVMLRKIQPKVCVVVCAYDKMSFIGAAKKLGIPTIEIQHGTISRYHLGYSYPGAPGSLSYFPDYFFSFGTFWHSMADLPIPADRIRPIGFFELERKLEKDAEQKAERRSILIISQWISSERFVELAIRIADLLAEEKRTVYLKLHPSEGSDWRTRFPQLIRSRVIVIDSKGVDIYELFRTSEFQVGVFSTALYEGLAFGLKTILMNWPGVEYMEQVLQRQLASLASSAEEVVALVETLKGTTSCDSEVFFKNHALQNFSRELEEVIRGSDQL